MEIAIVQNGVRKFLVPTHQRPVVVPVMRLRAKEFASSAAVIHPLRFAVSETAAASATVLLLRAAVLRVNTVAMGRAVSVAPIATAPTATPAAAMAYVLAAVGSPALVPIPVSMDRAAQLRMCAALFVAVPLAKPAAVAPALT